MNSNFYLLVFHALAFLGFGNVSFGQDSPSELAARLEGIAKRRSFDELMDSISRNDDGTFGAIMSSGMDPACASHVSSKFLETIYDPRVRKLYELSIKLGKEQAATKIEKAFRKKLKEFKSNVGGSYEQHGLHSTLFLASEFCSRDTFNQLLVEWVDWSRGQLRSGEYKERFEASPIVLNNAIKKHFFVRDKSPELLMVASLVLNAQIRQGKTAEEATEILKDAFAKAGWEGDLPAVMFQDLAPLDASKLDKPLTRVAMFPYWGGLGSADLDMQIKLVNAARNYLVPPGLIGEAVNVVEEAALDGIGRVEEKEDADRSRFENGTRLTFGRRGVKTRVFRKWSPSKSPNKAEAVSELERIVKWEIPEALQKNWEGPLAEAKKWINEVPEAGTDNNVPIRKRWPEVKTESDAERPGEPEYWIELEIVDASSLSGPPKKESEKDGDGESDK